MRLLVTGLRGQIVTALAERCREHGVDLVRIGRPELNLVDSAQAERVLAGVEADVFINTAAYTAVDEAEREPAAAQAVNAAGAGAVAKAAAARGVPVIQLSTDYVFDGRSERPYREEDATAPLNVYGASKRAGEAAVVAATPRHVILRTSWIYSPVGTNFLRTMLRLGADAPSVRVADDQYGAPTSAGTVAAAILTVAGALLRNPSPAHFGTFHVSAKGSASWADFAETIFVEAERCGRAPVHVERIASTERQTPAKRPRNSRLCVEKIEATYGLALPFWRDPIGDCVARLLRADG